MKHNCTTIPMSNKKYKFYPWLGRVSKNKLEQSEVACLGFFWIYYSYYFGSWVKGNIAEVHDWFVLQN